MNEGMGKIETMVMGLDDEGHFLNLNPGDLEKMGFKNGDLVKWVLNDDGKITIEKATLDEVAKAL